MKLSMLRQIQFFQFKECSYAGRPLRPHRGDCCKINKQVWTGSGRGKCYRGNAYSCCSEKTCKQTNDPNDKSFDLQDIIRRLTGGGAGIGGRDILEGATEIDGGLPGKLRVDVNRS